MAGAEIARGEPAAENGADRCATNARYCTAFSPVWAKFYTLSPQTSGKSRYGTLRIGGPALDCITTPAPETRVDYGLSTTKGSGERSRRCYAIKWIFGQNARSLTQRLKPTGAFSQLP